MAWIWYFFIYSFLGFLLEVAFARLTHGRKDRKCLLLLPLCPVYGLGACAILLLPAAVRASPAALALAGGLTACGVEYLTGAFYERGLGVSFWDYTGLPGSVGGKVCLPFALAWGVLSLPLVYLVHPRVGLLASGIPVPVTLSLLAALLADLVISALLLRLTGDRAILQWYRQGRFQRF